MAYYNEDSSARELPSTRQSKTYDMNQNERYRRLRENSYKEGTGTRKREVIKVDVEKFKKALISIVVAVSIATAGLIAGGTHVVNTLKESMVVGENIRDFQVEVISPETHRTLDNEHYYYDYDDIARHMEDRGQFDNDVYYLIANIGEFQANRVMKYTDYESIENYLSTNGYEDTEQFLDHQRQEIVAQEELDEKQAELDQMNNEFGNTTINEGTSYGGK